MVAGIEPIRQTVLRSHLCKAQQAVLVNDLSRFRTNPGRDAGQGTILRRLTHVSGYDWGIGWLIVDAIFRAAGQRNQQHLHYLRTHDWSFL